MIGAWTNILPVEAITLAESLVNRAEEERKLGKIIYPKQDCIFRALELTSPESLKVCIIGQDPYHGPGQANGLAFSVNHGVTLPPSLRNIFNELTADIGCPYPGNGDLSAWAERGVLLLNTGLTVEEKHPNSHVNWGWHDFTQAVFRTILDLPQPIVFLLWGRNAQEFVSDLDFSKYPNKKVLMSTHPSPFSARRSSRIAPAFIGSKPFSKTNFLLVEMGCSPVVWQL